MSDFGQAVFNAVFLTAHVKHMGHIPGCWAIAIAWRKAELDAVISQNRMNFVGNRFDQVFKEFGCGYPAGLLRYLDESKLAGAVNGNGEIQLAFCGLHFCNVDMEIAYGVAFEFLLYRLVTGHVRQATDSMALQAAVQG